MTVRELQEILKESPEDAVLYYPSNGGWGGLDIITEVGTAEIEHRTSSETYIEKYVVLS